MTNTAPKPPVRQRRIAQAICGAVLGVSFSPMFAAAAVATSPGETCVTAQRAEWTAVERWTWTEICSYRTADLVQFVDQDGQAGGSRVLTPDFLRAIATEAPLSDALGSRPVHIVNGQVVERLDLSDLHIGRSLRLERFRFESDVRLDHARVDGRVSFAGSSILGRLSAFNARIASEVDLSGGSYGEIDLHSLQASSSVKVDDALLSGPLRLDAADIGGSVALRSSCLRNVSMTGISVGVNVETNGSRFDPLASDCLPGGDSIDCRSNAAAASDSLVLNASVIEGSLLMWRSACFNRVSILNGRIHGDVNASGSTFRQEFRLNGSRIGGTLYLWDKARFADIDLGSTEIGRNVILDDAEFTGDVDLSNATVNGTLTLGRNVPPAWSGDTEMILSGAFVRAIRDRQPGASTDATTWPDVVRLDGFEYLAVNTDSRFLDRSPAWYQAWLERDPEFSVQPYTHIEQALRSAGNQATADAIAISRRDREINAKPTWLKPLWWLWGTTVGYGYGLNRAILYVVILVVAGALFAAAIPAGTRRRLGIGHHRMSPLVFSLARAIPLRTSGRARDVDLDDDDVPKWSRRYFKLHTLLGLAVAVVAATVAARLVPTV